MCTQIIVNNTEHPSFQSGSYDMHKQEICEHKQLVCVCLYRKYELFIGMDSLAFIIGKYIHNVLHNM